MEDNINVLIVHRLWRQDIAGSSHGAGAAQLVDALNRCSAQIDQATAAINGTVR